MEESNMDKLMEMLNATYKEMSEVYARLRAKEVAVNNESDKLNARSKTLDSLAESLKEREAVVAALERSEEHTSELQSRSS